jgi:cytochrome c oxidase cbb3-type subunit 3
MKFRYKIIFLLILVVAGASGISDGQTVAQPTATNTFGNQFPHYLEDPLVWLALFMLILIGISVRSLYQSVLVLSGKPAAKEETEAPREPKTRKPSLGSKVMKWMTRSVPVAREADVMLDHNYDGIRELDNQLPPWWKWGFYFTIAFAVVYLLSYHVAGTGKLSLAEYQDEMQTAKLELEARMKNSAGFITFDNVTKLSDPQEIAGGKQVFEKLCVACHGNEGQGNVGPNLTDVYWLNGGGIKNIFHTITEGVPAKGMISWKSQLSPKQIQQVASYILTLQGTHPAGAKEPQGEQWTEEAKTDSVAVIKPDSLSKS